MFKTTLDSLGWLFYALNMFKYAEVTAKVSRVGLGFHGGTINDSIRRK